MTTMNPSPSSRLVQFYDPVRNGSDPYGRTLSSILDWNDQELEYCHNYIQMLFPLPEPSPFNHLAPVIDRETFIEFRSRPELRARLRESLIRILKFYGFEFNATDSETEITFAENFAAVSRNWATMFNHNHLRITRILRSLRVLGLEAEAEAFFAALKNSKKRSNIGSRTLTFWTRAAERPLYIAPEDETDEGRGARYLYEYEKEKEEKQGGMGDPILESAVMGKSRYSQECQGQATTNGDDIGSSTPGLRKDSLDNRTRGTEKPVGSSKSSKRKIGDVDELS